MLSNPNHIVPDQVLVIPAAQLVNASSVQSDELTLEVVSKKSATEINSIKKSTKHAEAQSATPKEQKLSPLSVGKVTPRKTQVQTSRKNVATMTPLISLFNVDGAITNGRVTEVTSAMPLRNTSGYTTHDMFTSSNNIAHKGMTEFLMSEVVVTKRGPAHVFDGLNKNQISSHDAIMKLFPDASHDVHEGLLLSVNEGHFIDTELKVGDHLDRLLVAEGVVYTDVLQAQVSNAALFATCYTFVSENSTHRYLLIQETSSGNWYREEVPMLSARDACLRDRSTVSKK